MESAEHRTREEEPPAPESEPVSDDDLFFPRSEPAAAPAVVDEEPAFQPQSGPEPVAERLHWKKYLRRRGGSSLRRCLRKLTAMTEEIHEDSLQRV